jgi:hypothetical protein
LGFDRSSIAPFSWRGIKEQISIFRKVQKFFLKKMKLFSMGNAFHYLHYDPSSRGCSCGQGFPAAFLVISVLDKMSNYLDLTPFYMPVTQDTVLHSKRSVNCGTQKNSEIGRDRRR